MLVFYKKCSKLTSPDTFKTRIKVMKDIDCRTRNKVRTGFLPYEGEIRKPFEFYLDHIQPLVAEFGSQPKAGMHGLETHTLSVVFRGIDYALAMGKTENEIIPVVFACACHDMARKDDSEDLEHGRRAVTKTMKVMNKFPDLLNKDTQTLIIKAVLEHTTGVFAPEYISQCLWDADRTRKTWYSGNFKEECFSTLYAKHVAQHPFKYLEYQRKYFPYFDWSKQY